MSDIDTGVVDSLKALDPDGRLEKQTFVPDLAMSRKCQERTLVRQEKKMMPLPPARKPDVAFSLEPAAGGAES